MLPCDSCVEGPGNSTATYTGETLSSEPAESDPVADPLAIALLIDQGENVMVNDLAYKRLLGAKYLPTRLAAGDTMSLAAFAADDAGTGQSALLPSQPVTISSIVSWGHAGQSAALDCALQYSSTETLFDTGLGNIAGDPRFVSTSSPEDLHLDELSPCRNQGVPAAPPDDIDGDRRDVSPDIGADELTE